MGKIHPTALVGSGATLADDVEVGPYAIVEADVTVGPGTILRPYAVVRRYTTLGAGNILDSGAVIGGDPQDLKFDPATESYVRIGDNNVFREGVTISRATGEGLATVVGNNTYWMANSHAGHNCEIHDNVILPNSAAIGGHCTIGAGTILSANGATHQFVWVGEKVMFQGGAMTTMHMPPYVTCAQVNNVVSLNTIGLRRSPEFSAEDRRQIKEAFVITYRRGLTPTEALAKMDECTDWGAAAGRFRDFVRKVLAAKPPFQRGLCPRLSRIAGRHGN
jgi:UDP-N-acetylglucosamine acyltransferase